MEASTQTKAFPWYDGHWLRHYHEAAARLADERPEQLEEFRTSMDVLRTDPSFKVQLIDDAVDAATLAELSDLVDSLSIHELEMHEAKSMGRFIVHVHPRLTALQAGLVDRVSELAGERVEPSYNFLSMYTEMGICPVHLDAPESKWTLDLCISQSEPWAISFSDVVDWPDADRYTGPDWEQQVLQDPELEFRDYLLEPGQALLFSGSAQWHYRDAHPSAKGGSCNLAFFHFVPEGTSGYLWREQWADRFGLPGLGG